MKTKFYFKRIVNDKLKLSCFILILILQLVDLFPRILLFQYGGTPERADFNSFLANTGTNFFANSLLIWFLPLFLLLISSDDIFDDYKTGYSNILRSKWGFNSYIRVNLRKAFIISFFIIFIPLMLNLLLCHIIFYNSVYSQFDSLIYSIDNNFFVLCVNHPTLANIFFIFMTSFIAGLLGMASSSIALALHDRKKVYPISFVIWLIPLCVNRPLNLSFQPFTEYSLSYVLPTYLTTCSLYILITIILYLGINYYEKKNN